MQKHLIVLSLNLSILAAACAGSTEETTVDPAVDSTPPTVVSVTPIDYLTLEVTLSEPVQKTEQLKSVKCDISPLRPAGLAMLKAVRDESNPRKVRLSFNKAMLPIVYNVALRNIADVAENIIAPGQKKTFTGNGKVVFVTTETGSGKFSTWAGTDLDGVAGGNEICQKEAEAAGLVGTFKAWLSDATHSAADNIGPNSRGWVRTDGYPFATSIENLLFADNPNREPLVPVDLHADETPAVANVPFQVWTGTNFLGEPSPNRCAEWTSFNPADAGEVGAPDAQVFVWTQSSDQACFESNALYCFQTGNDGPSVPNHRQNGKLVFLGRDSLPSFGMFGLQGFDTVCNDESLEHNYPGTFHAWVSSETEDARTRIGSGPWVLPNGVPVADNVDDLTDGHLFAPINQDFEGTITALYGEALTGTTNGGLRSATCNDWRSYSSSAYVTLGRVERTRGGWSMTPYSLSNPNYPCDTGGGLIYCFEL